MEDNTHYYKDPPLRLFELMQDTLSDNYQFFLGSPIKLSQSAYPCVVVQHIASSNTVIKAATGQDNVGEKINIHVMLLDQAGIVGSGTTDTISRSLYETIQGRDPKTGFYMKGTVLYAIRTNLDLGGTVIDNDIDVNYEVSRVEDKAVHEAIITVVTRERVSVPDRLTTIST